MNAVPIERRWNGAWTQARRLSSTLLLSVSLVGGSISPALAQHGQRGGGGGAFHGGGQRGGGGAYHGGGAARAAPQARPAAPNRTFNAPQGRAGGASQHNLNQGRSGTPHRNTNINNNARHTNVDNRHANVRVDRSRDINVQRNTYVRAGARPYARAPYAYGGRRYYAHNAYRYHGYRPYGAWGVGYRPFGAVVATLAATAIIVSVANQQYRYDQGVWYLPSNGGYSVVTAPVGATVATLPSGVQTTTTNNYYYGGAYYEKKGSEYQVVAPQAGTVVDALPEGGEEVTLGDQKYVKFGDTYYQPIVQDGKNKYEVVDVK